MEKNHPTEDFRNLRNQHQTASRDDIERQQLAKLNALFAEILPENEFYRSSLGCDSLQLDTLDHLYNLPFTTKQDIVNSGSADQPHTNLTYPADQYVRFHRTSGTGGHPLVVLDTAQDWQWWINTWQYVLDTACFTEQDRAFLAFSFGPFIGFWSAHDAVIARGGMSIPGGGLSSIARLDLIATSAATVLFCTPTYALHLAEVAAEHHIDLQNTAITRIIVAGEPGGSLPATRQRIESAWNATLFDHAGASEVGPWGFASAQRSGIHVCEAEFIAEFINIESGEPSAHGELSELVLTSLGRTGSPVIRYKTGDLVRPEFIESNSFIHLDGGVLGRTDEMLVIRGVNVFPSSLDEIIRSFDGIDEYRMTASRRGELDVLSIEIEDTQNDPQRVEQLIEVRLGLHVNVTCVASQSLPRFEAKGKRFIDLRG